MPRFGKDGASMLLSPELHGVAKVSIAWVFMYLAATAFVSATKRTPAPGSPSRRPLDNQMVSGIHHHAVPLPHTSHPWRPSLTNARSTCSCLRQYWNHRVHGNMHEQAHTFFVSIWLHAMIVSPEAATRLGWTMLTLRGLYPITWALEGDHPTIRGPGSICVFCVAMPMIAISIYLLAMSAAVLNDVDLRAKLVEYEAGRYFSRHFDFDTIGCGVGYIAYLLANVFWTLAQPAVRAIFLRVSEYKSNFDPNDKRTW